MHEPKQQWWITGAGQGLGRELALLLARAGHRVYASARSRGDLSSLQLQYPDLIVPLPVDVSDAAAVQQVWSSLATPPDHLHGVILSAGVCEYVDTLPALDPALFRRVMDVNFFGAVHACHAALPLLLATRTRQPRFRPRLIGIGSLSSVVGLPRAEAYGASKAALAYFFDSLRSDLGGDMSITLVQPGFIATRLTATNDFAMPFLWSADEAARYLFDRLDTTAPTLRFPWQLSTLLRLAAALPRLWYGVLVPRLRRQRPPAGERA